MDENQKKEQIKLMAQVLIDKKNYGKAPYDIARLTKTNVREFKKISYKFKVRILFSIFNKFYFRKFSEVQSISRQVFN